MFKGSPHQGQKPELAKILFFGSDANYSAALSDHPFFHRIIEYHRDGVAFWQRYDRHHPFLLDEYPFKKNTGGVPYHRSFAALNLSSKYAPFISFVELLDVPTIGNSSGEKEFWNLFSPEHAKRLDTLLQCGSRRIIFLSDNVIRRMRKIKKRWGLFSWVPDSDAHGLLCKLGDTAIHKVFHFSDGRVYKHIPEMRKLIVDYCFGQAQVFHRL
ncbi:hypothetical protein A7E78_03990 [Syntrophotalea acetylenivorans]|uniref:Uncharacterized protein n=1 Tax=Syntrophotalea acetylenivorans TaxID=1842532 RepID=A0A1L3GMA1_9BACT|nr:hypothetical protein A7E78_03990 [Syntrophotalea acetylenivorans]